jgi:hypothetical protein
MAGGAAAYMTISVRATSWSSWVGGPQQQQLGGGAHRSEGQARREWGEGGYQPLASLVCLSLHHCKIINGRIASCACRLHSIFCAFWLSCLRRCSLLGASCSCAPDGTVLLVVSALPCQYYPLRACLCQHCACTFPAAHQIALCLVHVAC